MNRNEIDEAWRRQPRTRRVILFLSAFVAFALVGAFVAVAQDSARSAPAPSRICQPGGHPDLACNTDAQLVSKFKSGAIKHADGGFDPASVFKNPVDYKNMAHDKIVTFMQNHPKAEGELRAKYLTKRDPGCTDNCLAWKVYGDLMAHANCNAGAPIGLSPYTCRYPSTAHSKAVMRGITVAYCGGAVILGALGVFSTDGAAAPAAATIYGGIGCGWGFVASFLK